MPVIGSISHGLENDGEKFRREAILGIGHHHVADNAGIDLGLMAVKGSQDGFHQLAMGSFGNILRCRNQANASLRELLFVLKVPCDIAKEAVEGVDDDEVDAVGRVAGKFQHPLEFGPPVGAGRQTGFDEGFHEIGVAQHTVGVDLLVLLFERDPMVGLSFSADAAIADSTKPARRSLRSGLSSFCQRHHPLPGPEDHWPSAGRDRLRHQPRNGIQRIDKISSRDATTGRPIFLIRANVFM